MVSLCVYKDKGNRTDGETVGLLRTKCKVSHNLILFCKSATAQANETACHHSRRHESQHAIPTSSIAKRPRNAWNDGRQKRFCKT